MKKKGVVIVDFPEKGCGLCRFCDGYICTAIDTDEPEVPDPNDQLFRDDCPLVAVPDKYYGKEWRLFNKWVHLVANDARLKEINEQIREKLGLEFKECVDDDGFVTELRKGVKVNDDDRTMVIKIPDNDVFQVIVEKNWYTDGRETTECTEWQTVLNTVSRYH